MGFLFTHDRISSGRVPTLEDFEEVRRVVEVAQDEHQWLAFALFGSLGMRTHNRRSDADVLAVCTKDLAHIARTRRSELIQVAAERNIRLDFRLCTVKEGREGDHRFNTTHRLDMKRLVEEGSAKGIPHQWIHCQKWRGVQTDIVDKTAFLLQCYAEELARFKVACAEGGVDAWVECCWQRGRRPMRTHIRLARLLGWWHHRVPFDSRKESVLQLMQSPPFAPVAPEMDAMERNNRLYDVLLHDALLGGVSRRAYTKELQALTSTAFEITHALFPKVVALTMSSLDVRGAAA